MKPSTALALANQGNPAAIAQLLNERLCKKGVIANVTRKQQGLCITLEAVHVPERTLLLPFLWRTFKILDTHAINSVTIQAKRLNRNHIDWFEELPLIHSQ